MSRTYFPSLDGLRGVAALAVVGGHFENLSGISLHLRHSGVAVDFFFMLSGFVIAQAYEARLATGLGWRRYMTLRLERLGPAILAGLALGLAVSLGRGEILYPAMASEVLLLPVPWGPVLHGGELFPLNGPQWSLFLELAANAVHAATVRWLTTGRLAVIVALAAVALVGVSLHFSGLDVGWSRRNGWGGPPRVIFGFAMGLLIFRLRSRGLAAPALPYPLILLGLATCLVRPFPEPGLPALADPLIVIVILPALLACAASSVVTGRQRAVALWLGALSYPLYAIHAPLLRACEGLLNALPDDQAAVGWALTLPAILALAAAFERLFDAPIRVWLKARRHPRPAPAAPAVAQ